MVQEMEEDTTHFSHEREESVINNNDHILRQDTTTTYRPPKIEAKDNISNLNSFNDSIKKNRRKVDMLTDK